MTEYSTANKSVILSFLPTRLLDIEEEEQELEGVSHVVEED